MLNILFNVDNSAFEGTEGRFETSRILKEIADKIESGLNSGNIRDINGNTIGKFFHT